MIPDPHEHALYHRHGPIRIGVSEDILVYPDESGAGMYWVKIDAGSLD